MGRCSLGFVFLCAAVACRSPKKPVDPGGGGGAGGGSEAAAGGGLTHVAGTEVTPANVCDRIMELKATDCELARGYTLTRDECVADFGKSLDERGEAAREATTANARCLLDNDSCDAIETCMSSLNKYADQQDGTPTDFRQCSETEKYAPVGVAKADFLARKGSNAIHYSSVPSTKDLPIEVCGIPAEMEWLLAVTCDDGSAAFSDFDHAHASRVGNVGAGGRCGSIVDLYEVPCPEGTYQVFIDAYVCPLPD